MPLHRQHPVTVILQDAAFGNEPSRATLDRLLTRDDLPDGHDLNRHRQQIVEAAATVATTGRPSPGSYAYGEARKLADHKCNELAALMSEHEAALTVTEPKPESVDDIAARMFRR